MRSTETILVIDGCGKHCSLPPGDGLNEFAVRAAVKICWWLVIVFLDDSKKVTICAAKLRSR